MDDEEEYRVEYLDQPDSEEPQVFNWVVRPGKAKVTYLAAGGHTFEGTFDAEKLKQGHGVYVWMNPPNDDDEVTERARYEGNYRDGKKHGVGKMTFPNGDIYHGEWNENKMHGEGTFTYKATGDIFSGTWVDGKKQGNGNYFFNKDKSQFRGKWQAGNITEGTWALKEYGEYVGKFEKGRPVGPGKYTFEKTKNAQSGAYVPKQLTEEEEEEYEDEEAVRPVVW
eukprot:CAMPEP_0113942802 /NCGR_PEP_ID=MMETSP1339-20121228/9659_1 /TAXON_ID=94617 /ORGANISM="Fibrocapsa japonica" /LENGTH=223 /DNA_ID=CAMNT_0000947427 /DNA_START=121 /DNA_END=789 /DNA_ORIENTATION=- /assembly_acc=CAM_ASM_000762